MRNSTFIASLKEAASDFDAVSQGLFDISHACEDIQDYNPESKLYSLVRIAEKNTVKLRNLAGHTARGSGTPFYETMAGEMGISIVEERKWLVITVPAILPKRNTRDNTSYITRPLRNSLVQFQRENPIERFEHCAICIEHCYDEALGIRRVRDYDNIETKRYLDVIESVLLTNDSALLCTVLQSTVMSDRDCTKFYLMAPETLQLWVAEHIKTHT